LVLYPGLGVLSIEKEGYRQSERSQETTNLDRIL
jgi:hypothetical protein